MIRTVRGVVAVSVWVVLAVRSAARFLPPATDD